MGATVGVWLGASITHEHVELKDTTEKDLPALDSYTEGKMHRYKLLFAVNGGAFAVGQFLLSSPESGYRAMLPISYLAQGAILFTAVMTVDIWLFGQMMREDFVLKGAFTPAGKVLLLIISLLLIGAWMAVLRHDLTQSLKTGPLTS